MYNFYQSDLRKNLNSNVFHKPTGDVKLFGIVYQYIVRKKHIGLISLSWIQILGIQGLENHTYDERKHELRDIVTTEKPFFIQLGSIDAIAVLTPEEYRDEEHCNGIIATRVKVTTDVINAGFQKAIKENLPPSSYSIRTTNSIDSLFEKCNKQTQTKINKAQKKGIIIKQASMSERKDFMAIFSQTAAKKGFNIISENTLTALLDYNYPDSVAQLYVAILEGKVIAGAVYLVDKSQKTAIYLYGGTDRNYLNIGASHLLHRETWQLLLHQGCEHIDLLGGHPSGDNAHHLAGVGQFKEGFGGIKYDYMGSFDIVYNKFLYKVWGVLRRK